MDKCLRLTERSDECAEDPNFGTVQRASTLVKLTIRRKGKLLQILQRHIDNFYPILFVISPKRVHVYCLDQ